MLAANDLRRGMAIKYNGNPAIVLEVHHRTPSAATPPATSPSPQSWKPERQSTFRFSSRKARRSRLIRAPAPTWGGLDRDVLGLRQTAGNYRPAACARQSLSHPRHPRFGLAFVC